MNISPAGYRKLIGLTQKDLSEYLRVSVQSISRKENGMSSYTDEQKVIFRDLIRERAIPDITIDVIFFNEGVS